MVDRAAGAPRPISLLIVDDSLVVRTILQRMLAARPEFEVAGVAPSVEQAVQMLGRTAVDIILLDLEMPEIDGLTGLPRLIEMSRGARILMVSSLCASGAAASVKAMTLGAADTLLKPAAGGFGRRFEEQLVERLIRIGRAAPPAAENLSEAIAIDQPDVLPQPTGPVECIAIGSSTGGLHALCAFFAGLPAAIDTPIIITQHLPPSFMPYFAAQIAEIAGRPCTVASDGVLLRPRRVIVAPGDAHLTLIRAGGDLRVRLDREPSPTGNMPSVDPMLESLAATAGSAGVGIMLSGMGRDGARGALALAAAGGELLAQDRISSVVWGMPGAVARAGLASLVAEPGALARRVAARVQQQPGR